MYLGGKSFRLLRRGAVAVATKLRLANTFIPRRRRGAGLAFLQITVYTRPIHSDVKKHKEMKQDLHIRVDRRAAQVSESKAQNQ